MDDSGLSSAIVGVCQGGSPPTKRTKLDSTTSETTVGFGWWLAMICRRKGGEKRWIYQLKKEVGEMVKDWTHN